MLYDGNLDLRRCFHRVDSKVSPKNDEDSQRVKLG